MKKTSAFLALAMAAGSLAATPAQAQGTYFRYCQFNRQVETNTAYFSAVFSTPADTYGVGVVNAFNSFVTGRYDGDAISGANCLGPYDSYQEAANEMNDDMGYFRSRNIRVVLTGWRYRGD